MTSLYYLIVVGFVYWGIRCLLYAGQIKYLSSIDSAYIEGEPPKVSVLVPFCDEGEIIVEVAKKISMLEYPHLEVLYINDRSRDDGPKNLEAYLSSKTASGELEERCIHIENLPAGWLGKVHALQKGLEQAKGQWVLFMDADVMLEPSAVARAVTQCERNSLDHLALIAEFGSESFWTASLQAAFFSFVPLVLLPRQVSDSKSNVYAGVGAFQLIRRDFLQKAGGLAWLALEVIDDIGLGKLVKANGGRSELMSGLSLVKLNWYSSVSEMIRGTEKNIFAAMRYSLWSVGLQLSVSAFCFIGFIFTLYTRPPDILLSSLLCAALGFFLWGLVRYYRVWNFSFFHAASYFLVAPIIGWMLLRNSLLAWRKGGINWRGSFYPLQTLVENQRVLLAADFIFGYPRKESPSNEKY